MRAKEYLKSLEQLRDRVDELDLEVKDLHSFLYTFSGSSDQERVQTSKKYDKMGDRYAKFEEKQQQSNEAFNQYQKLRQEVKDKISCIKEERYRHILTYRYINFMSFPEIAERLSKSDSAPPKSIKYVLNNHGYALKEFEECHKEFLKLK